MKKLFISLALACASLCAQGPSCIAIQDTIYSVGPSGSQLMTGYIQLSLGYFTSNGAFTITQSVTSLTIMAKVNNLSTCITPSVVVQAAYTVTTGGRTPVHYTTYWYIPNTGGPYQLTGVPSGVVNVSGTPGVATWVSGLNFALASAGDTPAINGSSAVSIASVQSVTQFTLLSSVGTLTNATYSDGPIERNNVSLSGSSPPSIFGPTGAVGPTGATGPTGPTGGGGSGSLVSSITSLSDAQVQALGATPVQVVAAAGAGKIILPMAMALYVPGVSTYNCGTLSFSMAGSDIYDFGSALQPGTNYIEPSANGNFITTQGAIFGNNTTWTNQAMTVSCPGISGAGNGVVITIWYLVWSTA